METVLRAWFGCPKQLHNTIGRDEIVPSFIVNKERLVPSGGSEVVMNWQCTFLNLLSFVLCVFPSPLLLFHWDCTPEKEQHISFASRSVLVENSKAPPMLIFIRIAWGIQ